MIQLETLSGQPYDKIYLNEHDTIYRDIRNHIMKNIKKYPEIDYKRVEQYTMYVKTDIKLFNKGQLINFDDDISFDKEDSVLQIFIKYEYLCNDYHKIYNFTEENLKEQIINLIKKDGLFLNLVKQEELTEELCKLAVKQNYYALAYVKNQTEEMCKWAVQQNGYALQDVKNQTEEICKLAVQHNGYVLKFVKINQTEEMCKLAVQQNGLSLCFVKNQTEEICKLAVQQNCGALQYVKIEQTEEICKLAVKQNPYFLRYVPEHMKHLFM